MMVLKITFLIMLSCVSFISSASDLSPQELNALRTTVISICRGGTLEGYESHSTLSTRQVIPSRDANNQIIEYVLTNEQWRGVKVLINKPEHYAVCVEKLFAILEPSLVKKKNIDKDLNARISYIRSKHFCERLRYVISQAPFQFNEWRRGDGDVINDNRRWKIGPYIMGNASALGMTASPDMLLNDAVITNASDSGKVYFNEPILYTHRFNVSAEAGLLIKNIKDAIDSCITYKYFYDIEKVRYRGGPYKFKNGMPWWDFEETGFWGVSLNSFIVTLNAYELDYLGEWTKVISINVHTP